MQRPTKLRIGSGRNAWMIQGGGEVRTMEEKLESKSEWKEVANKQRAKCSGGGDDRDSP
jgi:hypothetical protein